MAMTIIIKKAKEGAKGRYRIDFDPWDESGDPTGYAIGLTDQMLADGYAKLGDPTLPISQRLAVHNIRQLEKSFGNSGSGFDILLAVRMCACHGLVMPDWLANEFCKRYDSVHFARAGSWDDPSAFGRPTPKGTQIAAVRKRQLQRAKIRLVVLDLLRVRTTEGKAIAVDNKFWSIVGKVIFANRNDAYSLYKTAFPSGSEMCIIQRRKLRAFPFNADPKGKPPRHVEGDLDPIAFKKKWGVNPNESHPNI